MLSNSIFWTYLLKINIFLFCFSIDQRNYRCYFKDFFFRCCCCYSFASLSILFVLWNRPQQIVCRLNAKSRDSHNIEILRVNIIFYSNLIFSCGCCCCRWFCFVQTDLTCTHVNFRNEFIPELLFCSCTCDPPSNEFDQFNYS